MLQISKLKKKKRKDNIFLFAYANRPFVFPALFLRMECTTVVWSFCADSMADLGIQSVLAGSDNFFATETSDTWQHVKILEKINHVCLLQNHVLRIQVNKNMFVLKL